MARRTLPETSSRAGVEHKQRTTSGRICDESRRRHDGGRDHHGARSSRLILRQAAQRPRRWWHLFFADPQALARDYQKAAGTSVGEVMTRAVVSVSPALDLGEAARASASDEELVTAMRARIKAEPWTSFGGVVEAFDGVIRLSGVTATETERSALETMARTIPGCRGVDNRLIAGVGLAYTFGA